MAPPRSGHFTDKLTQFWVRMTGVKVLPKDLIWLSGPVGIPGIKGKEFYLEYARSKNLKIRTDITVSGIIENFDELTSTTFNPSRVNSKVWEFYTKTANYDFDVWSEWSLFMRPFGWLVGVLFGRRLEQLNVPLSSLETSRGISSEIIGFFNENNERVDTGWYRTYRESGRVLYAGIYSICTLPHSDTKAVKVVFPLPNGSATVVMKPSVVDDGALLLESAGSGVGDAGFYFILKNEKQMWVRYMRSLKERIRVFVDSEGSLRADHDLTLFGFKFLRLHYRMTRRS